MSRLRYWWMVPVLLLALCLSCGSKGAASRVSAGEASVDLRSCVAVLVDGPADRVVQVTFFAEELTDDEMAQAAAGTAPREVNGKPAVFRIDFKLREGATALEFASLTNCSVRFYDAGLLPVPATTGWAATYATTPWEAGTFGIMELGGTLEKGAAITARVEYHDECADGTADDGGIPLMWDIEVDCPLRVAG